MDSCWYVDSDLTDIWRDLEIKFIILIIFEFYVFIVFRNGDIVNLVEGGEGNFGWFKESEISFFFSIKDQLRFNKNFSSTLITLIYLQISHNNTFVMHYNASLKCVILIVPLKLWHLSKSFISISLIAIPYINIALDVY